MMKAHAKQRLRNETWKGEKMYEKWRRNEKTERDETMQKEQGKKFTHARRRLYVAGKHKTSDDYILNFFITSLYTRQIISEAVYAGI